MSENQKTQWFCLVIGLILAIAYMIFVMAPPWQQIKKDKIEASITPFNLARDAAKETLFYPDKWKTAEILFIENQNDGCIIAIEMQKSHEIIFAWTKKCEEVK